MNLRNKVVGTVSAVLLAATMTAGMASAANDVTTSVTLNGANGTCIVTAATGDNTSFGSFTWDATQGKYVLDSTLASVALSSTVANTGAPGVANALNCGISVSASGTIYSAFSDGALSLNNTALPANTDTTYAAAASVQGKSPRTVPGTLTLDASKVLDTVAPTNYSATLTFTATTAN
jgi:hypothetical protein